MTVITKMDNEHINVNLDFLNTNDRSKGSSSSRITNVNPKSTNINLVTKPRPWARYFARYFDMSIFGIFMGILSYAFGNTYNFDNFWTNFVLLFFWILVESILLSILGTTPGKWLFNITITNSEGNKPVFSDALNRSFSVWAKGMGLGIPVFSLFTLLASYNYLEKNNITSWDRENNFIIKHGRYNLLKIILVIFLIIIFILLIVAGQS